MLAMPETMSAWEYFVVRHCTRGNLLVHFVSFVVYWGSLSMLLLTRDPHWLLVWVPSGLIGTLGHYVFEEGTVSAKEAAFSPAVPFYVTIMFWRILRGTYFDEVRLVKAKYGIA
jgi:hypothetical protein